MEHFETWEHSWHYFPATMCIVMFLIMAICFYIIYRRKGFSFESRGFRNNWSRGWSTDCCRTRIVDTATDILKKRYIRGEINKEEYEQMKRDIADTN